MASLEMLTRLSEPSIRGAQVAREISQDAASLLDQTKQDYRRICEVHPKLAFLVADNRSQIKLCKLLEANLRRNLAELESTVQSKWQQSEDLHKEMATVIEMLKIREVSDKEFRSPAQQGTESDQQQQQQQQQQSNSKKHTLYDHIDQAAVDALQVKTKECLDQLKEIADANIELGSAAVKDVEAVEVPATEDITITWDGLREVGILVEESETAVADIEQDLVSMGHHCDQLKDTIKDLETKGGALSIDDYKVLEKDTDEVPVIIADLQDMLVGVRRRADEINVRCLQYTAFYDEYKGQIAAVAKISAVVDAFIQQVEQSQASFSRLVTEVEVFLDEMWNLISWYRNFHSAYDSLVGEVHRRRQAQRLQHAEVEDIRAKLDAMYMGEVEQRSRFLTQFGPFLPSDLCPFIQDPPVRFAVEEVGDVERLNSVQSHETRYSKQTSTGMDTRSQL
ncbi:hypothetical protein GGI12_000087 [Dipsacomyces acuminosporus]|nr:hypothetical protein GGI12_000087 [Dipsacomyces acuminosporus]